MLHSFTARTLFTRGSSRVNAWSVQKKYVSIDASVLGGLAPGIPPSKQSPPPPPAYLNVSIPDLSQPDPEPPVDIPLTPDFWESSATHRQQPIEVSEPAPKLLVVAGASTHHGGGPSHNLLDVHHSSESTTTFAETEPVKTRQLGQGGVFSDVLEDIGLPPPTELKAAFRKLFS